MSRLDRFRDDYEIVNDRIKQLSEAIIKNNLTAIEKKSIERRLEILQKTSARLSMDILFLEEKAI